MSAFKPKWSKFSWSKRVHWLSPLLLVSLSLHAIGLSLPIPPEPEKPEDPTLELLEPIQVSTLPIGSLPTTTELKPPPELNSVVEPEPEPVPAAPPPILTPNLETFPLAEEPLPQPVSQEDLPPEDLPPEDLLEESLLEESLPEEENSPSEDGPLPDKDPPPAKNPPSEQSPETYSPVGTTFRDTAGLNEFSTAIQGFASEGPKFLNGKVYALEYTGDRCYQDEASLSGAIGVLIDEVGSLKEGRVVTSTGYDSMNEALDRWFLETKGESPSEPSNVQPIDSGLYGWLLENHGDTWFDGVAYEAYYFQIEIELVNNSC